MKNIIAAAIAILLVNPLMTVPTFADPPPWAGGKGKGGDRDHEDRGKGKGHRGDRDREDGDRAERRDYFNERHEVIVRTYYEEHYRGKKCPPGLAKKNNGCMPPGQAKKWQVGRPLPRDVVYYPVPAPLVAELGPPPPQHRYVRVAGDILLIAAGTGMVVAGITDLGRK